MNALAQGQIKDKVVVIEHALNAERKVICHENVQVPAQIDRVEGLVSNVVKKVICHENVQILEKTKEDESLMETVTQEPNGQVMEMMDGAVVLHNLQMMVGEEHKLQLLMMVGEVHLQLK